MAKQLTQDLCHQRKAIPKDLKKKMQKATPPGASERAHETQLKWVYYIGGKPDSNRPPPLARELPQGNFAAALRYPKVNGTVFFRYMKIRFLA
jgi:hypothetical protein